MMNIKRIDIEFVQNKLKEYPVVAILGPRQVGKTTLALELGSKYPSIYLDLESERDRAKLINSELYFEEHSDKLIILDEIQLAPELFKILRSSVDRSKRRGKHSGQFLILGSASLELLKQSGESLAGRICYHELAPLLIAEVSKIDQLWLRGGFPLSFLASTDYKSIEWRRNFIRTYLERDIPQLGPRIPAETLKRFWTMLAHRQMTILNISEIAKSLSIDGKTASRYLDLFVDLLLVRKLSAWHGNISKRLVKSPKVYIRDSGLCHALLNLENKDAIYSHPVASGSWESFAIENITMRAPRGTEFYFYRTQVGAEIDLILNLPNNITYAVEIKYSETPTLEKGFYIACEDVKPNKKFVVYLGNETYPYNKDITALSLESFCKLFIN